MSNEYLTSHIRLRRVVPATCTCTDRVGINSRDNKQYSRNNTPPFMTLTVIDSELSSGYTVVITVQ
jgi:hypothetical protein